MHASRRERGANISGCPIFAPAPQAPHHISGCPIQRQPEKTKSP
ncbi:hypothetical protein [Kingella sp. (in: b-proteobacteria)]|nr:hypothetical protein [Kingella sp. (in: b-proteobacteria)]MDO4656385.1 hypothetical protein [Kingella sp. (in: b-proteobacteria)]